MAAVLTPQVHDPRRGGVPQPRPALRLVEGGRGTMAARYRRRRIVAGLLAAVLLAGAWNLAAALWPSFSDEVEVVAADASSSAATGTAAADVSGAASSSPSATARSAFVVVQPGDTLWSIASELSDGGDVRPVVDELASRVGGGSIQVGQRISLEGIVD